MSDKNFMDVMRKFDPDGSGSSTIASSSNGSARTSPATRTRAAVGGPQEGNTGLKVRSNTPRKVLKPNSPNWSVKQIEKLLAEKIADKGGSVRKAFQRYDEDRTGELTYPEMRRVFGSLNIEMSDEKFAEIMRKIDSTNDGCVDYHEFIDYFGGAIAGHADTGGLARICRKTTRVEFSFGK